MASEYQQSGLQFCVVADPIPQLREVPTPTQIETPVFDSRTEKRNKAMEDLEKGIEGFQTSEGFQAYLNTLSKFHHYSWGNALLIHVQKPEATQVNSYNRWIDLGRQVRKGESGIKIFYPRIQKRKASTAGDEDEESVVSFGLGNVFDISQTDGDPLPEPPEPILDHEEHPVALSIFDAIAGHLAASGVTLETKKLQGTMRGYWMPSTSTIALREEQGISNASVSRVKTLVHETGHYLADHRGGIAREDGEAVAEGAAYVVMSHYGIDTSSYSFPYVASWSEDIEVFKRNVSEIGKIADQIIDIVGELNAGHEDLSARVGE